MTHAVPSEPTRPTDDGRPLTARVIAAPVVRSRAHRVAERVVAVVAVSIDPTARLSSTNTVRLAYLRLRLAWVPRTRFFTAGVSATRVAGAAVLRTEPSPIKVPRGVPMTGPAAPHAVSVLGTTGVLTGRPPAASDVGAPRARTTLRTAADATTGRVRLMTSSPSITPARSGPKATTRTQLDVTTTPAPHAR